MRQLKITKSITNRESASLDKYLQEIGREDLITVEEEVELAQRIKKGDRRALEKLTRANLRFVVSVAKQYQNQGLSLPEKRWRCTETQSNAFPKLSVAHLRLCRPWRGLCSCRVSCALFTFPPPTWNQPQRPLLTLPCPLSGSLQSPDSPQPPTHY